jgi:hypothetical protein
MWKSIFPPRRFATKALDIWLPAWRRRNCAHEHILGVRHVMIALCDHFEPLQDVGKAETQAWVKTWQREFAKLTAEFRDADGVPPRHTFFYPVEQYETAMVTPLAELCQRTGCETEIHLRHENGNTENLRETLEQAKERLARYGLLARDDSGALRYGVVHGQGALDTSHPQGRHRGVRNDLAVLRQTGCYADFTPAPAPERTPTRPINRFYYARGADASDGHEPGRRVRAERGSQKAEDDELLLVQGPLGLDWQRKKFGIFPSIENGHLTAANPPTRQRLRTWLECRISVEARPNWLFIKLHTHGANPENARMLLGEPMRAFHRSLAELAAIDPSIRFHYVSARELVNILHAAESGHSGEPGRFRDYRYRRAAWEEISNRVLQARDAPRARTVQ